MKTLSEKLFELDNKEVIEANEKIAYFNREAERRQKLINNIISYLDQRKINIDKYIESVWLGMQTLYIIDLKREDVFAVIKAVGGMWAKHTTNETMYYTYDIPGTDSTLSLSTKELPPCCKLVKKIVHVEAHYETTTEIECPKTLEEIDKEMTQ